MSKLYMTFTVFSIVLLILLNILGSARWDYTGPRGDITFKKDTWADELWIEFQPPFATGSPIEVPLVNKTSISTYQEIKEHMQKHALSGELANKWIERTRITDIYYGLNIVLATLIISLIIKLLYSYRHSS